MSHPILNHNFTIKLRNISGDFNAKMIRDGLVAMEHPVQLMPIGKGLVFHDQGISTRLLHLRQSEKGMELVLPPFSSPADWELLRDWLLVFFSFHSAIAIAEDDWVEDIEQFFDSKKIQQKQLLYADLLNEAVLNEETLHFFSVHREFYAGHKIFERLRKLPAGERLSSFYDLVRASQYIMVSAPSTPVGKISEHLSTSYSLMENKGNMVLQPADMIKIIPGPKEEFFISYSSIDKLIRHGWSYLDEKQIFIPEMNTEEWKGFCNSAREMSINTELFSKYVEGESEDEE
jgi:hypothetical protein